LDDPWRDEFFKFIDEHRDATIYHATASDGIHMLIASGSPHHS
jgi:hypothetical protein